MRDVCFVLVGQCGAQLGGALFNRAAQLYTPPPTAHPPSGGRGSHDARHRTSRKDGKASGTSVSVSSGKGKGKGKRARGTRYNAVMVDTELKAVRSVLGATDPEALGVEINVVARRGGGAGGNYALGYHGRSSRRVDHSKKTAHWKAAAAPRYSGGSGGGSGADGGTLHERALDALRGVAEQVAPLSFVMVHALAGGTGSGLGARLLEEIRDEFPAHHLVTLTVAPFSDGENPMQSYNSVLCHRALDLYADAIVLVSNDDAVEAPRPSDPRKAVAVPRVSIEGCNNRIAAAVVGALAPVVDADGRNGAARHCSLWEVVGAVAPSPAWKLLRAVHAAPIRGTAESVDALVATATKVLGKLPIYDAEQVRIRTLGAQVTVRGFSEASWSREFPTLTQTLARNLHPVEWNPYAVDTRFDTGQLGLGTTPRYPEVAALVNRTDGPADLQETLRRAEEMFEARAYWHWYAQCGCEQSDMDEAFERARGVVANYASA